MSFSVTNSLSAKTILLSSHLNPAPPAAVFELLFLTCMQYGLPFYLQYLAHWPEYFQVAESASGEIMGYSMCT